MLIRENRTRKKLKSGLPAYGVISTSGDPQLAELFGLAGFDYFMLDTEHGLMDPSQVIDVIRACERVDLTPMVRIGSKDPKVVLQYIDAGMMGIMMPGLESVSDVKMLVDAVKYAPVGRRGLGMTRASGYVSIGQEAVDYINFSNEQTMAIPQFEHPTLIDRFEEMIAQPGVDAVVIGPRDLSLNMGFLDGPNHPEVQAMIDRVITICKKQNVTAGITSGTRADSANLVARGASLILAVAQSVVLTGSREFLPE